MNENDITENNVELDNKKYRDEKIEKESQVTLDENEKNHKNIEKKIDYRLKSWYNLIDYKNGGTMV